MIYQVTVSDVYCLHHFHCCELRVVKSDLAKEIVILSFPVVVAQSDETPPALVKPDLLARAEGGRGRRRRR